ncbi:uncharacterized protein FIBRA_01258 [Fibroporia radiculosa]|uniref:Potassium transport protein n=1 Tax=Fibroporia radiculosa TaxID=599839 RepID=J4G0W1_9APHY|nr:uncharacterized protein FIBRA_01258 [Fibroporia radiculosa]CCL99243.1 predicted protein [Fibroporia radiculosa]
MPSLPSRRLSRKSWNWLSNIWRYFRGHLNFYRVHILVFLFAPLIFSAIIYAANGEFHIAYIDCLFNSVSAFAVCGLASIDLSRMTPFQQALLFIQLSLGNIVVVSWVMVYIRRSFFAKKFQRFMEADMARKLSRQSHKHVEVKLVPWWRRAANIVFGQTKLDSGDANDSGSSSTPDHRGAQTSRLRPDMIRRMDDAPRRINPSGWISEARMDTRGHATSEAPHGDVSSSPQFLTFSDIESPAPVDGPALQGSPRSASVTELESDVSDSKHHGAGDEEEEQNRRRVLSDPQVPPMMSELHKSGQGDRLPRSISVSVASPNRQGYLPRTQTIEFAATPRPLRSARSFGEFGGRVNSLAQQGTITDYSTPHDRRSMHRPTISMPHTFESRASLHSHPPRVMDTGFGGFPMPFEILSRLFRHFFPKLERKLTRTVTMPRTRTIVSQHGSVAPGARPVSYISFEAVVGRNSTFKRLTHEQLEELGGVEYRALGALLWIVGGYHLVTQLMAFTIIAPYVSIPRWSADFKTPQLFRNTSPIWFSAFQVASAYTNAGMSLVDQSMLPFQEAYPMIVAMIFVILAGNTAFPIFLRFTIWILSKLVPRQSRLNETLHFLLDHPRRCFIYLFPSHQTWFLLTILTILNTTDWFAFLVLDLGNSVIGSIPVGVRVIDGMLQAVAVRAAGFGIVPLAALAPAVKVLYVIMMYISVYPVAMSVRSTNVYEEKSLGVFEDDQSSVDVNFNPAGNRVTVWSRYLAMHMRKQLAFDMWWLAVALVLICIVERDSLENPANATWFNIFNVLFETVSAYGGVGLSLGVPYDNFSLSGAFSPLSKLIICAVMLRGRHRGLPVAIDRAVMLPSDFDVVEPPPTSETPAYHDEESAPAKLSSPESPRSRRLSVLRTLSEAPSRDTPDRDEQDRPVGNGDVSA